MQNVNYGNITTLLMSVEESNTVLEHMKNIGPTGLMVEWGSGGSTCKWIENLKFNQQLISIEHNHTWYQTVKQAISDHFGPIPEHKFKIILAETEKDFVPVYGWPSEENPVGLRKYINPTEEIFSADLYLIDGIARAACLMAVLLNRKNKDSTILIHDFQHRLSWYNWASQFCKVEFLSGTLVKITYKN